MKSIVIDCRLWGVANTGIGRYCQNLIREIAKIDHNNKYILLFRKHVFEQWKKNQLLPGLSNVLPKNFVVKQADVQHYTFKEQIVLAQLLRQLKPDIWFSPDINHPVFRPFVSPQTRLIITIHDLVKLKFSSQASKLPFPLYVLKYLILRYWVFQQAVQTAVVILTPSKYSKSEILTTFSTTPQTKVHVTYEAPDTIFYTNISVQKILKKYHLSSQSYYIYTGNAYPHKNVDGLLKAYKLFLSQMNDRTKNQLVLVCSRSVFLETVQILTKQLNLNDNVVIVSNISDSELAALYNQALAFIFPSFKEGFGLPGLEAMAAGTLVISSNRSSLPEIYQQHAEYFDPYSISELADKMHYIKKMSSSEKKKKIAAAKRFSKQYTWSNMAKRTLDVLNSV